MPEIVVLVPVYQRPQNVAPLIASFNRSRPKNARLVFVTSRGDEPEHQAIADAGADVLHYPGRRTNGDWAKKINYGYRHTDEPWILCGADDIRFHEGWDKALRRAMLTGKRVLGTEDLNPHANKNGIYSPHPMVARTYVEERGVVDRKGLIVCEQYSHNYPDRELAATAISRDEWLYVPDAILEHLHPAWTEHPADDTYLLGAQNAQTDYRLHLRRSRMWHREKKIRERALSKCRQC